MRGALHDTLSDAAVSVVGGVVGGNRVGGVLGGKGVGGMEVGGEVSAEGSDAVVEFFEALAEASRRLAHSRVEQRLAERHGLDLLAYRLTLHVREEEMRVGELARRVVAHASHTSRALADLEKRGWITRRPTPEDRRVIMVRTTPEGSGASRTIRDELRAELAARVADWSDAELAEAAAHMRRLADAF